MQDFRSGQRLSSNMSSTRSVRHNRRATRVAKKKVLKKSKYSHCVECGFRSTRAFNVIRHYARIHEPCKRLLKCCGKNFTTKGQFYQHVANQHPETRQGTVTATKKYKIVKKEVRRRPIKGGCVKEKEEAKEDEKLIGENCYFDENTPLINYCKKNSRFVEKDETIKSEFYKASDFHPIHIFFKGNVTSSFHSRVILEFLSDIDFNYFEK